MGRVISITNQKGGVGKTTTAVNLSSCLALNGQKVLLIDFDSQGNATTGLGFSKNDIKHSIYRVLVGKEDIKDATCATDINNLFLIPSNIDLVGAEVELVNRERREFILKEQLEEIKDDFAFIIIDCPPSLNIFTLNSLIAADTVIIPVQTHFYALEGLSSLMQTISRVKDTFNPDLQIEGLLITMYDPRTNLSKQVTDDLKKFFKDKIFKAIIPLNIRLAEAPSFGKPIIVYSPNSTGAFAYINFTKEIMKYEKESVR